MFAPDAEEECFDPFSTLNLRFKKAIAALKKRNDKCYDAWTMLCDGRVCFESVGRPAVLMNPSTEFDLEVYRNQVMYQYQVLGFFLACHPDLGLNFLSTAGANHIQKCSHSKLTWSQLLFHSRNSFCHKKTVHLDPSCEILRIPRTIGSVAQMDVGSHDSGNQQREIGQTFIPTAFCSMFFLPRKR